MSPAKNRFDFQSDVTFNGIEPTKYNLAGMNKCALLATSYLALSAVFMPLTSAQAQSDGLEISGNASVVVGVTDDDTVTDADAKVKVKGTKILESGLEVGGVLEARLDGDVPDQYWAAGRYSGITSGGPRGLGLLDGDAYLQSAYAYARGGFGFISLGRDDGIASQLAVTSPTIFSAIGVNDWKSDPTGLNDVHTINDFSGQSTKLTYQPPANFLGGVLGGLKVGFSYAPELPQCEEGLCAPVDGYIPAAITLSGAPLSTQTSWENVLETAFYYEKGIPIGEDRITVGLAASYVSAEENGEAPITTELEEYKSYALGLNVNYAGITVGGSVKNTNAGFADEIEDGYLAFDAGITYETGQWGFMLGYGNADANADSLAATALDQNFYRETETAQAGVSYVFSNGVTLGAAAQFIDRESLDRFGDIETQEESAAAIFESSIDF